MSDRVRAEQVDVIDGSLPEDGERPDYEDAFALNAQRAIPGSAEQLARRALEEWPALRILIRLVHSRVLGFRLAPGGTPGHIVGWRLVTNEPEVVRLETAGWFGRAAIVCRRTGPGAMHVHTALWFDHRASPAVWALIGPLHRLVARLLMERVAVRGRTS